MINSTCFFLCVIDVFVFCFFFSCESLILLTHSSGKAVFFFKAREKKNGFFTHSLDFPPKTPKHKLIPRKKKRYLCLYPNLTFTPIFPYFLFLPLLQPNPSPDPSSNTQNFQTRVKSQNLPRWLSCDIKSLYLHREGF